MKRFTVFLTLMTMTSTFASYDGRNRSQGMPPVTLECEIPIEGGRSDFEATETPVIKRRFEDIRPGDMLDYSITLGRYYVKHKSRMNKDDYDKQIILYDTHPEAIKDLKKDIKASGELPQFTLKQKLFDNAQHPDGGLIGSCDFYSIYMRYEYMTYRDEKNNPFLLVEFNTHSDEDGVYEKYTAARVLSTENTSFEELDGETGDTGWDFLFSPFEDIDDNLYVNLPFRKKPDGILGDLFDSVYENVEFELTPRCRVIPQRQDRRPEQRRQGQSNNSEETYIDEGYGVEV